MKRIVDHLITLAITLALSTPAIAISMKSPGVNNAPRALTPPPKEWAMFPDEPPAAPPAAPNAPPPNQANAPQQANQPSNAAVPAEANGGIVSAKVNPAPARELPILWIAVTALLSIGAIVACGGLIFKNEELAGDEAPSVKMVAGVPVVSDEQEIR